MKQEKLKSCENCDGKCCRYVAMELDCPEKLEDFEDIKWYVSHENVIIYVEEDGTWNIQFDTKCRYLGEDNKCLNYEKRPQICREYDHDECLFHNDYKEIFTFKDIKDVEEYIEKIFNQDLHVIPEDDDKEEDDEE